MRLTWLISSLIIFIFGVVLIKTLWWLLIGLLIGVPLILLSFLIFFLGLIMPSNKIVHKHYTYNFESEPKIKKAKVVKDKKN